MSDTRLFANEDKGVLVVDLDGTLTPTDTLVETVISAIKRHPAELGSLVTSLLKGKAEFKGRVAELAALSPRLLPWREDVIRWLEAEKAAGRRIVLATGAHHSIAAAVADHLRLFDDVLATRDGLNLKGLSKLDAIRRRIGGSFAYAGDSSADVPVWNGAASAIVVGKRRRFEQDLCVPIERVFDGGEGGWRPWLQAMRPHQWVKNALVFVPLFTAFAFADSAKLLAAVLAFVAFCFAASATYLLNDIWDVESDRAHPRKRSRPFASGQLSLLDGIVMAVLLMAAGAMVAASTSSGLLLMLLGYAVLTTAYSWTLKRHVVLDVVTLAVLYTWRVLAGAVAVGVTMSPWLLAFSVFIFLSLALVKRCAELVALHATGRDAVQGRDYTVRDLVVLWPLGIGATFSALVVFGLYIGSPEAAGNYGTPELLWILGIALLYWLARIWIKTARGEMHDDPIVFAFKDRGSVVVIACIVGLALAAHSLRIP